MGWPTSLTRRSSPRARGRPESAAGAAADTLRRAWMASSSSRSAGARSLSAKRSARSSAVFPHRSRSATFWSSRVLAGTPSSPGAAPGRKRMPTQVAWLVAVNGRVSGPATRSSAPSHTRSMQASGRTGVALLGGWIDPRADNQIGQLVASWTLAVGSHVVHYGRFLQDAQHGQPLALRACWTYPRWQTTGEPPAPASVRLKANSSTACISPPIDSTRQQVPGDVDPGRFERPGTRERNLHGAHRRYARGD